MDGERRPIRHANEFLDHYGIPIHHGQQTSADLVVFSRNGESPTHIGIMLDPSNFVHAPGNNGTTVIVDQLAITAIAKLKAGSMYNENPIGFKRPTVPIVEPTYRRHQSPI